MNHLLLLTWNGILTGFQCLRNFAHEKLQTHHGQWMKKSAIEQCYICNNYVANRFALFRAGKGHGHEAITSLVTSVLPHSWGHAHRVDSFVWPRFRDSIPNLTGDYLNTFSCPIKVKGETVCGSQARGWCGRGSIGQLDATIIKVCLNLSFSIPEMSFSFLLLL